MAKTPRKISRTGQAALDVMVEALFLAFRLRAWGKQGGHVSPSGGGVWGLLRSLALEGPQTVPQLARARPVTRQHIQVLADDMAAEGLVEFVPNPAHKRSKLLRMTAKGRKLYDELDASFLAFAEEIAEGMDPEKLEAASAVLSALKDRLALDGPGGMRGDS